MCDYNYVRKNGIIHNSINIAKSSLIYYAGDNDAVIDEMWIETPL